MSETSAPYQTKTYPPVDPRRNILNHPYTQTVKEVMLSMIASGYTYDSEEDLCYKAAAGAARLAKRVGSPRAIACTDALIEKVEVRS